MQNKKSSSSVTLLLFIWFVGWAFTIGYTIEVLPPLDQTPFLEQLWIVLLTYITWPLLLGLKIGGAI